MEYIYIYAFKSYRHKRQANLILLFEYISFTRNLTFYKWCGTKAAHCTGGDRGEPRIAIYKHNVDDIVQKFN